MRFKLIRLDGDDHTHFAIALLSVHNLSSAAETNWVVWLHIFKHQGELDWLASGEEVIGEEEHTADAEFSGDARVAIQFHEHLNPKALRLRA